MTGSTAARVRAGFTLIELLVVMSIIATLLMIAVPRYFQSLERAKEVTLRQDLAVMRDAIDKFFGDTGRYPETLIELVDRRYVRSIPADPYTKSAETWLLVQNEDAENAGVRDVRSSADGVAATGVPFSEL